MSFDKKEYDRKWYQKNKESRKESNKKYYKQNKKALKTTHKLYRIKAKFNIYKNNAKQRKHIFELTKEQFDSIIINTCYYCNSDNNIGIDRLDSLIGYTINNCVPCCSMFNKMKNTYTENEFIDQCILISLNKS